MIIALVGPKGAGKSTIGRMLHAPPDVVFLDVESLAQRGLAEVGGTIDERYAARVFEETVRAIEGLASRVVIVESTAASASTQAYFDALGRARPVRFVRVGAGEETCAERITTRDQTRHVAVSADMIRAMHARSVSVVLPWSLASPRVTSSTRRRGRGSRTGAR